MALITDGDGGGGARGERPVGSQRSSAGLPPPITSSLELSARTQRGIRGGGTLVLDSPQPRLCLASWFHPRARFACDFLYSDAIVSGLLASPAEAEVGRAGENRCRPAERPSALLAHSLACGNDLIALERAIQRLRCGQLGLNIASHRSYIAVSDTVRALLSEGDYCCHVQYFTCTRSC